MKRIKMALNLQGLDPSGTELLANGILVSMTNNTNFPNAVGYLAQLATGISDLHTALTAPQPNSASIQKRVIYVKRVLNILKAQVELECDDDEEKALSSGFILQQSRTSKPKVFDVTQGTLSGSVDLVCPYAGSHAAYVWEMTTDVSVASGWTQFKITNTTSTHVSGLSPGVKYWFRVKAIVQDEEQSYSDPHLVHVV